MTGRWFGLIVIIGMSLFALWVFPDIQTMVPLHSNDEAVVDLQAHPFTAIFLPPLFALGLYLIILANRPGQYMTAHEEYVERITWLALNMTLGVLCVMYIALLGRSLGWVTEVRRSVVLAFGLATIILGYYLPKARSYEWIGIRTPWTLTSRRIWNKTHQFGRWIFFIGGMMICIAAWLPKPHRRNLSMIGFICTIVIPVFYSYLIWRREFRRQNSQ
jgi:uncharacterized membrane protein